jgi:hypothetical protein
VGLRAGLDRCGKSRPPPGFEPGSSSPQAVAIPTTLPGPQDDVKEYYINQKMAVKINIGILFNY